MKKALCAILSLVMILTAFPVCVFAENTVEPVSCTHEWEHEVKTDCNGECGYNPVIVVPGIMQSQTYVQTPDGKDIMTSDGFPIMEGMDLSFMFDSNALLNDLKGKILDILKAIATRDREGLFDILMEVFENSFKDHYFNDDGTEVNKHATDEYWYSLEECANTPDKSYNYTKGYSKDENGNALPSTKYKNQYDFIYRQVDIGAYCQAAGYDHAYYYAYSSFGNILDSAAGLNEYIDMVKYQTGHDKVDLVFISLGGTIADVYLSKYIDKSEVGRIILAACALDGSYLLGDLMGGKTSFADGTVLYNDLIPNIVELVGEEYMALAYLGNVIARAIPQDVFDDFLQEALDRALDDVLGKLIRNCQSMWALVPSAMYPELSEKYISDDSHKELKTMTDEYYQIQLNAKSRLQQLDSEGVDIFVIAGYNLELPAAVEHFRYSSDNIIQSASTTLGGTFADNGAKLPDDYKPAIDESYIDSDRIVDAGTCALPDKTFLVKNQSHLTLQSSVNDVIGLCVALLTDKTITDARENSGGYPQFNEYRNLSTIESLLRSYNANGLEGKSDALDAAVEKAQQVMDSKVWSASEAAKAEEELYRAMDDVDALGKNDQSPFVKYKLLPFLTELCKKISDIFRRIFKGNDFWLIFIPFI
ncbi:MAG: hypothetical protein MJ125_02460 [Clostridia bacterium]|nr:hypothetical protein [Clostridia bacterium]